jgi:hypothetical protein
VFHLDVVKVDLNVAYVAIYMHVSSVSSVFSRILQMFQLDVSKVDQGEHMLQWPWWWGTAVDQCAGA